jgi:hypothetical protein
MTSKRPWNVRMKMRAEVGWDNVLRKFNIHEEDNVLFGLHEIYRELHLMVEIFPCGD